ncbi:MAG: Trm112 family protein [Alphaproteobacteria bacterium]|nr:Trm112 family protein [Alphaproteobacteria bacterium]
MADAAPPAAPPDEDIDPRLLSILVCPVTRGPLHWDRERRELVSKAAGLAYPVRDGIPIMLPDEARELEERERA